MWLGAPIARRYWIDLSWKWSGMFRWAVASALPHESRRCSLPLNSTIICRGMYTASNGGLSLRRSNTSSGVASAGRSASSIPLDCSQRRAQHHWRRWWIRGVFVAELSQLVRLRTTSRAISDSHSFQPESRMSGKPVHSTSIAHLHFCLPHGEAGSRGIEEDAEPSHARDFGDILHHVRTQ
jgi:hypothetical protein